MNWFKSWFTKDKETPTTVEPEAVITTPSEPEIEEPQYKYVKDSDGVIRRIQKYTNDELKPFYKDKALYLPYEERQRILVDERYVEYYTIKYRIISEPVVSFVETVRNNPSRFIIKKEETENKIDVVKTIKDTKTGISFSETVGYTEGNYEMYTTLSDNCKWLSEDELEWAKGEIYLIYKERAKKLEDIKKVRERRHLMKIYYVPNTVYEEK